MKFYYAYHTTYHNNTRIGTIVGELLTDETPVEENTLLTWDTLDDYYKTHGLFCKFNVWNFNKGHRVSFFHDNLFPKKDERDVKEWKTKNLNIRVEVTYQEFNPSIEKVLKWHDSEKAIIYLNERGLNVK